MADDKTPLRLSIYHQTYSLLVSGDPNDMLQAANVVDELISSIAKSRNLDATRAAVFACLHLADRVRRLERELAEQRAAVEQQSSRIASLLDGVIED